MVFCFFLLGVGIVFKKKISVIKFIKLLVSFVCISY